MRDIAGNYNYFDGQGAGQAQWWADPSSYATNQFLSEPAVLNVPPSFQNPVPPLDFSCASSPPDDFLGVAPESYLQWFTSGMTQPVPNMLYHMLFPDFTGFTYPPIPNPPGPNAVATATIPATYTPLMPPGWAGADENGSSRVVNVAKLSPDLVAAGNVVTLRVSAGFLTPDNYTTYLVGNVLQLDQPSSAGYVRIMDSGQNNLLVAAGTPPNDPTKITLLKDSDGNLQHRFFFDQGNPSLVQHLELTVEIGSQVQLGACDVEVELGAIHSYPEIPGYVWPAAYNQNQADGDYHVMAGALNLIKLEWVDQNWNRIDVVGMSDSDSAAQAAAARQLGVSFAAESRAAVVQPLENPFTLDIGGLNGKQVTVSLERGGNAVPGVSMDFNVNNNQVANSAGGVAWFLCIPTDNPTMFDFGSYIIVGVHPGDCVVATPKGMNAPKTTVQVPAGSMHAVQGGKYSVSIDNIQVLGIPQKMLHVLYDVQKPGVKFTGTVTIAESKDAYIANFVQNMIAHPLGDHIESIETYLNDDKTTRMVVRHKFTSDLPMLDGNPATKPLYDVPPANDHIAPTAVVTSQDSPGCNPATPEFPNRGIAVTRTNDDPDNIELFTLESVKYSQTFRTWVVAVDNATSAIIAVAHSDWTLSYTVEPNINPISQAPDPLDPYCISSQTVAVLPDNAPGGVPKLTGTEAIEDTINEEKTFEPVNP